MRQQAPYMRAPEERHPELAKPFAAFVEKANAPGALDARTRPSSRWPWMPPSPTGTE